MTVLRRLARPRAACFARSDRAAASSKNFRPGFTMLELLLVIAVIGLLAALSYPALKRLLPDQQVRSELRRLESLMQKARQKASNIQKPVRVVVNCARAQAKTCVADLQTAVRRGSEVSGWETSLTDRRAFNAQVSAAAAPQAGPAGHDGEKTFPQVHWAIFMPDGRVFSDPRPFKLFMRHDSQSAELKKGWSLSVGNDSGRVFVERAEVAKP
ncbi:MAG: prepilin-type N-terminal cleavage/methylation domain-containing protein [Deltaproteobacteria bacterium]|jgi:prepilin-type N-terminal cleavage/methylation domain-containing protein|nr:prepilin-type N-terminal cleavage/methylation domain-containing protein [Deltaproteobacteria bacterium]